LGKRKQDCEGDGEALEVSPIVAEGKRGYRNVWPEKYEESRMGAAMREADCDELGIVDRAGALRKIARAIGERNMATTDACYRRSWTRMRGVMAGIWRKIIMLVCRKEESSRSGEFSRDDGKLKHAACDCPRGATYCYQHAFLH
jgi:hypothetical protein